MALTRNQWVEMWATLKTMEYDMIHFPYSTSPYFGNRQRTVINDTKKNIESIKSQVESVIGEME